MIAVIIMMCAVFTLTHMNVSSCILLTIVIVITTAIRCALLRPTLHLHRITVRIAVIAVQR